MTTEDVVARFPGARPAGPGKWIARCPHHDDDTASLSISRGADGRTVMHCHAGCATADVLADVSLAERDLFAEARPVAQSSGARTYYVFQSPDGAPAHRTIRVPKPDGKKSFFQQRFEGGKWVDGLQGARLYLYRLPELMAAPADRIAYVVEGEKDVDNLRACGEVATTNPMGAGKWRPEYAEALRGRHVVVLPDHDPPGAKHGEDVARSLRGVAASVRVVLLPGLLPKGDVSDWLAAGHAVEELHALVAAEPEQATIVEEQPRVVVEAEVMPAGDYRFSESEAARRFGDIIRGRAVFAADEGQWNYFDGQRWTRDHGGVRMLEWSLEVSRAFAEDGVRAGSNDSQFQARMAMAKAFNGLSGRKRLIELARAEPGLAILSSQFDADPWLLNCLNGTINLKSGKLQDHNPADLITKLAPVNYDRDAKCSRWEQFLAEVVTDAETIPWLAKAMGYSATGDCSERVAFFAHGPTTSGKSVLVETDQFVLGDYAVLAPTSLLIEKHGESHPCDRMVLKGARFAVFPELPRGQRFDLPTFKTLTGNDTLTGRGMRENFSTFKPTAKLWMTGNHKPIVSDPDDSTWVRMRVIPIEKTIPTERVDRDLRRKLTEEAPGILAWIVRGALAWQRDGLGDTAKVRAATTAYKIESDRLGPFFGECCTFGPDNRVSRVALRAAYESWCTREGEHPINPRDFGEQIRQRGVTDGKIKIAGESIRGWQGIGLRSDAPKGGQVDTSGQHFPDNGLEEVSRGTNRESVSTPDHLTTFDAPDPIAQLAHCLRAKPGTTATDEDRAALAAHFSGLNGKSEETAQRLWSYWKADPAPTVPAFLARETRRRIGA
jgi:putative DNA primase/helicase